MSRNTSSGRVGTWTGLVVIGVIALAGCSAAPTAGTGAPPTTGSGAPAAVPSAASDSATPGGSSAIPPAAGGGATDFCAAWAEYQDARNADTPEETGAGFRAAATDIRANAPADIKQAAGLLADVLDDFGQSMLAGGPQPETLGQGQSAERRQGLADAIAWITKNCP